MVTFTRDGDTNSDLAVSFSLSGTAISGLDYSLSSTAQSTSNLTIPAGANSSALNIIPLSSSNLVVTRVLTVSLANAPAYVVGTPAAVDISVSGNTVPFALRYSTSGATLNWTSTPNRLYQVAFKNNLTDAAWTIAGQVTATSTSGTWTDPTAKTAPRRFYLVAQVD
jgi:hypothetical protein